MARDIEECYAVCPLLVLWHMYHAYSQPFLTSESISIATGAGGRRGALGPDDRGKGTLLFDSRKN